MRTIFAGRIRYNLDPELHKENSENYDKSVRMCNLIWVFAGIPVVRYTFILSDPKNKQHAAARGVHVFLTL